MALTALVIGILFILGILIFFRLLKKICKAIFSVWIITIVLTIIIGFYIYADIADVRENFSDTNNLIILNDQGTNIAAFNIGTRGEIINLDKNLDDYFSDELLLADYYKVIVIDSTVLSGFQVNTDGGATDSVLLLNALRNNDSINVAGEKSGGNLFGYLYLSVIKQEPTFVFRQFRNDNTKIIPESVTFKLIKYIPNAIFQSAYNILK